MTARGLLALMTVAAILLGALVALTIMLAVNGREQSQRIDTAHDRITLLRERVVRDEAAICRVLVLTPDGEQSRQIAVLARAAGDTGMAEDALRTASGVRLPAECIP